MTPEKKAARKERNKTGKLVKAAARKAAIVQAVRDEEFFKNVPARVPKSVPSLAWQNAKSGYKNSGFDAKHRPGNHTLHESGEAENHERSLAAHNPVDATTEATIGQFADFDAAQGAAIDHSVATGEPLFAVSEDQVEAFEAGL